MHDGSVSADLAFTLKPGDAVLLADGDEARVLADHANDLILAARCAESVGLMQRMIAGSVYYLGPSRTEARGQGKTVSVRVVLVGRDIVKYNPSHKLHICE